MQKSAVNVGSAASAFIDLLANRDDLELQEIVDLAAELCGTGAAGITLFRDGAFHVPVTRGVPPFVCPADDTFCQFTMETPGVYTVEDAADDPRFAHLGWVNGRLALTRFYASAPLTTTAGDMVGRLCVIDPAPGRLDQLQERALESLASNVMRVMELRLVRQQIADTVADRSLTQVAELSHDLRVPATSILASAEMLAEEIGDDSTPTVRALLQRLTGATRRMTVMLERTMDCAAEWSSAPAIPTPREAVDLATLARQFVEEAQPWLEPRRARVEVGLLPVVSGRSDQLYSVLQNLVTNGVKFARPDTEPEVRITGRLADGAHRISVVDNGSGIPLEMREQVFIPFHTSQAAHGGHGIGLAAVRRIVTAHGGQVGIADAPGGGTEVWFTLPA